MDDLTAWLRQQLDDDERVAREADPGPWHCAPNDDDPMAGFRLYAPGGVPLAEGIGLGDARHIARHDPARVLAEVDAKRRRLDRHQPDTHFLHGTICRWCSTPQVGAYQSWPCPDVRDDAAIYANRPGYRPEWGPDRG